VKATLKLEPSKIDTRAGVYADGAAAGTSAVNGVVTSPGNIRKKRQEFQGQTWVYGALGGTRTPTMLLTATSRQRVYQFRHERLDAGREVRNRGADVTNRPYADKAAKAMIWRFCGATESAAADGFRQHLLDFDRDPVAIDQHDARGDRQRVGEDLDFVGFGGVEFDDGAAGQPHDLVNRHGGGSQNHHEVDTDFIEGWHRTDYRTDKRKIA
jgi:hypothetical protein